MAAPCCNDGSKHSAGALVVAASTLHPSASAREDEHARTLSDVRLRLPPWSSRKLARSVGASWRLSVARFKALCRCLGPSGKHSPPECQRQRRRARTLSDVRLRLPPWSSRKLARSVGAPWRLPIAGKPRADIWSSWEALATGVPAPETSKMHHVTLIRFDVPPLQTKVLKSFMQGDSGKLMRA